MNKVQLIKKISESSGITKAEASIALNTLIESVGKTLKSGNKITLVGFGTFSVSKKAAKTGKILQKSNSIISKTVKFKASDNLQIIIGGGTDDTGPMRTKK